MDGISNLFQNKLFLQFLSNAGAAMSEGKPIGPALNQVTQQNISAQNFSQMLTKILGGGGKFSMDQKGMKMDIPQSALGEITKPSEGTGITNAMNRAGAQQLTGISSMTPMGGGSLPNPFRLAL